MSDSSARTIHVGSKAMPAWNVAELIDAPRFTWQNWFALLGPGLVMGGSAIGGGEWLLGPKVTAVYGGALLWLTTLSVLGQCLYNIEISRYALYSGEPIFSGKFRTWPGPMFWLCAYLLFDFGSVFPYLAANAATPVATLIKGGQIPNPENIALETNLDDVSGEIIGYTKHRLLHAGALDVYTTAIQMKKDRPGVILSVICRPDQSDQLQSILFEETGTIGIRRHVSDFWLMKGLAYAIFLGALTPLLFGGKIYNSLKIVMTFKLVVVFGFLLFLAFFFSKAETWVEILSGFFKFGSVPIDVAGDGPILRGENVDNIFVSLAEGRGFPEIDFTLIGFIAGLAAIAGSGGLSNTPVSNYTRDQGWGMGHHVGAIPSAIGGRNIELSHVGCVFEVNEQSLPKWRRWYKHVLRDQLVVWMPACFVGLALPAMLSIQFLKPGASQTNDDWTMAVMTAQGVQDTVTSRSGVGLGQFCWFMTVLCGFLVLAPTVSTSADGIIRRWVDVFWTSSKRLRAMEPKKIRLVYFRVLCGYAVFGLFMLSLKPGELIKYATMFYNVALGISCWHSLAVNLILLPRELRPCWLIRISMALAGAFFLVLGVIAVLQQTKLLVPLIEFLRAAAMP